jgi:hypothetical protein
MANTAPAKSGLADVLRANDIVTAVIVDDAFDVDLVDSITDEDWSTFNAEMKHYPEIEKELIGIGLDTAALLKRDKASLTELVQKRSALEKAKPFVETFLNDYLEQRGMVDDLARHLRNLNLAVVELGANQPIPQDLTAQIAFVDFYLDDQVLAGVDTPAKDTDPSENARKKAREIYELTRAFVFLMSSRDEVSQEETDFLKRARLLRGYFQFQKKTTLSDDQAFCECLGGIPLTAEFRHTLHDFIDCLDTRAHAITKVFMEEVRGLGLEDYAQLRQLSLNKDGHPFGDYIFRMFGHFMTSLVLEDTIIGTFVNKLDATEFQALLPIRAEPTPTLGKIYLASLTEKLCKPIPSVAAVKEPATPVEPAQPSSTSTAVDAAALPLIPLELGDLFVKDASNPIYAVMNPACDLALGVSREREPDDAVLLIPGSLRQLYESYKGERAPTMFTPIYEMGGTLYRVDWDYRRFRSIPHKSVAADLLAMGYRCERRLHLGPALELQQHFASSISRVGLPVPPPMCHSHDALLYCRGVKGEWEKVGEAIKAAIITLHTRAKDQFIIPTTAAKPIREAIRTHVPKLRDTEQSVEWSYARSTRAQYAGQLNNSLKKWFEEFPFLHTLGNLPGGREQEKKWNDKKLEVKEKLGLARDLTLLTPDFVTADAVLVVDLSPMLMGQAAMQNEMQLEMEEG